MKTQVHLCVKDESFGTKFFGGGRQKAGGGAIAFERTKRRKGELQSCLCISRAD